MNKRTMSVEFKMSADLKYATSADRITFGKSVTPEDIPHPLSCVWNAEGIAEYLGVATLRWDWRPLKVIGAGVVFVDDLSLVGKFCVGASH